MGLDFGNALSQMFNQMNEGAKYNNELYKDKISQEQRNRQLQMQQQQVDYSSPVEMSISPQQIQTLVTPPDEILRKTFQEASQLRPDANILDSRTGKFFSPPQNGPSQQAFDKRFGEQPLSRSPQGDEAEVGPIINLAEDLALKMGLRKDPVTGGFRGPGRQVQEYYDQLGKMVAAQTSIYSSMARPTSTQIIQPDRPTSSGRRVDPNKERIAQLREQQKLIVANSGLEQKLEGFNPRKLKNPEQRLRYQNIQQQIDSILGVGQAPAEVKVEGAKVAPGKVDIVLQIKADKRFPGAVAAYMKTHPGVDAKLAENIVLEILKKKSGQ